VCFFECVHGFPYRLRLCANTAASVERIDNRARD